MLVCQLVQVPLGVILKNENIREEMLEILTILHKYVPYRKATGLYVKCMYEVIVIIALNFSEFSGVVNATIHG